MKKQFIIAITTIVVSGCASLTTSNILATEHIDSKFATIRNISIEKSEDGILYVRGNIKRRFSNEGKIPGHINVDILNSNGKVLSKNVARLRKKSLRSTDYKFFVGIDGPLKNSHLVRVTHDVEGIN